MNERIYFDGTDITPMVRPELVTNDDPEVGLCTFAGEAKVEHDYRPFEHIFYQHPRVSWRCVWCHAVACGNYTEPDPCWEPYHHDGPHRSRSGVTWPLGGNRPDATRRSPQP